MHEIAENSPEGPETLDPTNPTNPQWENCPALGPSEEQPETHPSRNKIEHATQGTQVPYMKRLFRPRAAGAPASTPALPTLGNGQWLLKLPAGRSRKSLMLPSLASPPWHQFPESRPVKDQSKDLGWVNFGRTRGGCGQKHGHEQGRRFMQQTTAPHRPRRDEPLFNRQPKTWLAMARHTVASSSSDRVYLGLSGKTPDPFVQ